MENVAFKGVGVKTEDASPGRDLVRKDLLTELLQEGIMMPERAPNHSRPFAKITSTLSLICIQRLSMFPIIAISSLKLSRKNLEISI